MLHALSWLVELLTPNIQMPTDTQSTLCTIIKCSIWLSFLSFAIFPTIILLASLAAHSEGLTDRLHQQINTLRTTVLACLLAFCISEATSKTCQQYLIHTRDGFLDSQAHKDILAHTSEMEAWSLALLAGISTIALALQFVVKPWVEFIDCISVFVKHDLPIVKHRLFIYVEQRLPVAKQRFLMFKNFIVGFRSACFGQSFLCPLTPPMPDIQLNHSASDPIFQSIKTTAQHPINTIEKTAQSHPTPHQLLNRLKRTTQWVHMLVVFAGAVMEIGCMNCYLAFAHTFDSAVDMWDFTHRYMCEDDPEVLMWLLSCAEQPELWD
ncbi:hypothetical protein BDY17DRAFT_327688 [Neohortaea acidophila]|uniref:Uncharacterized protein n=1 Tax=Neohortaea acidophila TaxID=245834 RepID=A0A6A6PJ60_9PEZI|nr:uncharacterized protein BDY17DRAFT_327688 [Neohortaea acidophila]KAF2479751.1 hypothetical protein BDY17DRAFT_327688 [Neohortaea acidophila]